MWNDIRHDADIALDDEIKAPIPIDPGLPDIIGFVIFLGVQRRVLEIANEISDLLEKRFVNWGRKDAKSSQRTLRIIDLHRAGLDLAGRRSRPISRSIDAAISLTESKGP